MKGVTTWRDILVLNCWVNLRSRLGWFASILVAALIALDLLPRLQGRSVGMTVALYCVVFVVLMTIIWLVVFMGILLVTGANLLRRGCIGQKTFTITNDVFAEDDGWRVTQVPWRQIRSIDKTSRHIFVRTGRWKYVLLAARDFENEYEFAQYYADLVRARQAHT
jgi:hypothetical protein